MDKLDTRDRVNGPDGVTQSWETVDWREAEQSVRRLRQRIFTASKVGDLKKVRNLQKLMLRSRANALISVRRVTEVNAGRVTAGVDGKVISEASEKATMVSWIQRESRAWGAQPVKRVYIPKSNGKKRPLGIPVITDRALQALAVNALEPEWEARFEPKSYGFRPGRGCHDAIEAVFTTAKGPRPSRPWVLDADLAAAFDRINHQALLAALGSFPAKGMVSQWLTAGVLEKDAFSATTEGTPQGGVISPLLMNVALHGMEKAAGVHYVESGYNAGTTRKWAPVLIRYADDFLVLCHTRERAEEVKEKLAGWLVTRGLAFNEEKTRIVHLNDGCDFLGFAIRRYRGKLLIKPSAAAIRRIRDRLTAEVRSLRGSNAAAVIHRLNPIIRGWAAYYRIGVSSSAFRALDYHMWHLTYSWARHEHRKKSKHWVVNRYYGKFHPTRQDRWVFGDRESGAYLQRFTWTAIVRHSMVKGISSPDDPTLAEYWTMRRTKKKTAAGQRHGVLRAQDGLCPLCRDFLLYADHEPQSPREWEQWVKVVNRALRTKWIVAESVQRRTGVTVVTRLVHGHCLRRAGSGTANLAANEPIGLA